MNDIANELINEIMLLGEAGKKPAAKKRALKPGESSEHPGYYHRGRGYYSNVSKDGPVTHKTDDTGKMVALSQKEKAAKNKDVQQPEQPEKKVPKAISVLAKSQQDSAADPELNKLFGSLSRTSNKVSRMQALKAFEMSVAERIDPANKKQAEQLLSGIKGLLSGYQTFLSDPKKRNEAQLRKLVETLQTKYKFYSNKSGESFKTQMFGMSERHIFGRSSALSKDLVKIFDEFGVDLRQTEDQDKGFKRKLAGSSKPDVGKPVKNTPRVNAIFEAGISQLPKQFWQVYGPTSGGDILDNTGGKNARVYFEQSVTENNSLTKTIQLLEGQGLNDMARAIRNHQDEMSAILRNWSKLRDPKQREKAVQDSYAKMAVALHSRALGGDSELCSAIMKNLAEINLYDQEIAGGKEVYLPSHGSFPGADKIVVTRKGTKVERIDKISVKYGKSGKVYGMPAQSSNLSMYHKNKFYRGLTGGRVGMPGFETGVSSTVLDSTVWMKLMKESGYLKIIGEQKARELNKIYLSLQSTISSEREKLKKKNIIDIARLIKSNPNIDKIRSQLRDTINKLPLDKLETHIGKDSINILRGSGPMAFASLMTMHATIITGQGFPDLIHCHQEISTSQAGIPEYLMGLEFGSTNLHYWRPLWREADERGGGLLLGYHEE